MTNVQKALLSLLLAAVPSSHAAGPPDWYGLWRAVDPLDGGVITLSVSGGEGDDGAVNLRFSDTFIRACTSVPSLLPDGWVGAGPVHSKRGIYLAEAKVDGDKLVSAADGADDVPIQIYCFGGADDADKAPEGSPGVQASAKILWTFQHVGGSIVMSGTLFSGESSLQPNDNATATAGGDLTVRFHRESAPLSSGGWNGMYAGVDPLDGGLITLSVSDGGDGAANLRFSDTFIRACTSAPGGLPDGWVGAGTPDSKRGIYLADAKADGSKLMSHEGADEVPIQIYCFAGPDDATQPGAEFQTSIAWTFTENDNGYFIMSGTLFTGENSLISTDGSVAEGGDNAVRFHKIADGAVGGEMKEEATTDASAGEATETSTGEGEAPEDVAEGGGGEEGASAEAGAAEGSTAEAGTEDGDGDDPAEGGGGEEDAPEEDGANGSGRFLRAAAGAGSAAIALFSFLA